LISMFSGTSGHASSSAASVGMRTPRPRTDGAVGGAERGPASSLASAAADSAGRPVPSVVRSTVSSWITTTTPSAVACTSSSRRSAPAARPAVNASSVFSGAVPAAPRCAKSRGRGPSR
jgi:hypothetical protein